MDPFRWLFDIVVAVAGTAFGVVAVLAAVNGGLPDAATAPLSAAPLPVTVTPSSTAMGAAPSAALAPGRPKDVPVAVSVSDLERLPQVSTHATIPDALLDPEPTRMPDGIVVRPLATIPAYRTPGDPAIAAVPTRQLGGDLWLPVIDERPGWVRVLLPSRPQHATAWLVHGPELDVAYTPYRILVDRAHRTLTLTETYQPAPGAAGPVDMAGRGGERGVPIGTWPVSVGRDSAPTPAGRTYLAAAIRDPHVTYSPILLPLGTHSTVHTTYRGGPGTIAIHTWPTSQFGTSTSDGCIRVPADALRLLAATVPLGTPVLIT